MRGGGLIFANSMALIRNQGSYFGEHRLVFVS